MRMYSLNIGATSCRSSQPGAKSQGQVARKEKQQLGFFWRHNGSGMSGGASKGEVRTTERRSVVIMDVPVRSRHPGYADTRTSVASAPPIIRYRELSERGDTSRFAFGPLAIRSWANPWGFSSDFPPRFARQAVPPWTDYRGATSCRSSQPGAKSQGQVARKKKQQLGFLGRHNVFGMSGVGSKSEARDGRDWRSRYHGCAAFANRSETANYRRGGDSNPR